MAERITVNSKKPVIIKENLISHRRKTDFRSNSSPVNRILYLQRTIGNQAVQRLIKSGALQAKLKIGQPGDVYEQEANRVADEVMKMPEPEIQRQVDEEEEEEILQTKPLVDQITPLVQRQVEEEEEEEMLQAKSREDATSEVTNDLESQINVIKGGGQPLAESERAFYEPRFGADFSGVRVHTNARAANVARSVNARAFTLGHNVVFGTGEYSPDALTGRQLLAHELTHVIQQEKKPKVIQRQGFASTMEVCHNYLKSRDFRISAGGIRVTTNARISDPSNPNCRHHQFSIELRKKGIILNDSYGACDFSTSQQPESKAWGGLPEGEYYLGINRLYDNPYCCLAGEIEVIEESGVTEGSCTDLPPGPLEILHSTLQAAGMIPALGVIPDAIDTSIYAIEGNWVNTGISAAAMIPIFGQGATLTRTGVRVSRRAVERVGRRGIELGIRSARAVRIGSGFIEAVVASARRSVGQGSAALRKLQRRINDSNSVGLFSHIPLEEESAIRLVGDILNNAVTQRFGRLRMSGFAGERGIAFYNNAGRGVLVRQSDGHFITFLEEPRGLRNIFR